MDWIVGVADARRLVDAEQALAYVRSAEDPAVTQLVVERAAAGEYLNLFLSLSGTWATLFRVDVDGDILVARRPGRLSLGEEEVAFAGKSPHSPWYVPARDTMWRAEALALLEEYVRTGAVPTEVPARVVAARPDHPRQLLLFEDAVTPVSELQTTEVRWEPWR